MERGGVFLILMEKTSHSLHPFPKLKEKNKKSFINSFCKETLSLLSRCLEWRASAAKFAIQLKMKKNTLFKDIDQQILLLFAMAFGQTNPFYGECDYLNSSNKDLTNFV